MVSLPKPKGEMCNRSVLSLRIIGFVFVDVESVATVSLACAKNSSTKQTSHSLMQFVFTGRRAKEERRRKTYVLHC